MKKVAIIGGGIFGTSVALKLCKEFDVTLFERSSDFLNGASTNNHLRHHYGYHYPRSKETALESIKAKENFEKEYGGCVIEPIPAYYGVSKENTLTTPEEFIKFCDDLKLPYQIEYPSEEIMDRSNLDICVKVPEPAYDPNVLREIVKKKILDSEVKVKLKHEVVGGEIKGEKKILKIKSDGIEEGEFDFVISSIYSNFNNLNKWFGFPKKKVEYALMELLDMRLPIEERIALTIVDGVFSTFIPLSEKGVVRLGHVRESVLKKIVSDDLDTELMANENTKSNRDKIIEISSKYYPILKKAEFLKSIFITRVVKANVENTDERPTEITNHGSGIYSIFGGKVITCVDTAEKIADIFKEIN